MTMTVMVRLLVGKQSGRHELERGRAGKQPLEQVGCFLTFHQDHCAARIEDQSIRTTPPELAHDIDAERIAQRYYRDY